MRDDDIKFIKNILRKGSVRWPGRSECLRLARKKVFVRCSKNGQRIYKYYWQCAQCKQWSRNEKSMEVDHIIEIGSFTSWDEFIEKLFPRPVNSHLQVLCVACHLKKTMAFNSARTKWKRKN